jgi:hypothetical protein
MDEVTVRIELSLERLTSKCEDSKTCWMPVCPRKLTPILPTLPLIRRSILRDFSRLLGSFTSRFGDLLRLRDRESGLELVVLSLLYALSNPVLVLLQLFPVLVSLGLDL